MKCTTSVFVFVVLTGCGEKKTEPSTSSPEAERQAAAIEAENKAPVAPKPAPKPSKFEATVDLTLTGAIDKKFQGAVGICGATFIDGRLQGGNYGVRTDELEFQILAMTDKDLAKPTLILNLHGKDRKSFVGKSDGKNVQIDVSKGATIDAVLKSMGGADTVKVTGSITCGPDYRK